MMNRTNPWQSYRQIATQTASPGQLILMLYEGGIGFIERALAGFGHDDPLECNLAINNNLLKAQAIIDELNHSLNMSAGGQFADTMRGLYNYFDRKLQEGNTHKDPKPIEEVLHRMKTIRDAWAEMLQQGGPSTPAAASATAPAASATTPASGDLVAAA